MFVKNNAKESGGSVQVRAVNEFNVTGCIFEGNHGGSGGAMYVHYFDSVRVNSYISNCTFVDW